VKSLQQRQTAEEQQVWDDALFVLADGDHYLLTLIDGAKGDDVVASLDRVSPWLPSWDSRDKRPRGDWLRLILAACAVLAFALVIVVALASGFGLLRR